MSTHKENYDIIRKARDNIIDKIYYDGSGYGSVDSTWKQAKEKYNTITTNFVRGWFEGNVLNRKNPKGKTVL